MRKVKELLSLGVARIRRAWNVEVKELIRHGGPELQAGAADNSRTPQLYPFIRFVIPPSQVPVSIVVQYMGEDQFCVYTQPIMPSPSPPPSPLEGEGERERGQGRNPSRASGSNEGEGNPFDGMPEEIKQ